MTPVGTRDPERRLGNEAAYLSHSRINRYLTCPEQYRLHYIERLRPRRESANLVFGATIHLALAEFFRSATEPAKAFAAEWEKLQGVDLQYSSRESWESLGEKGRKLCEAFLGEAAKIDAVLAVEQRFEVSVSTLRDPFIGYLDLIARIAGRKTIVDFKTASSAYEDHEVILSDQLTAYWMADPTVEQVALCVLIKTKEPRITWHHAARNPVQLQEYLEKVRIIAGEIAAGRFYRRPGKHCGYCDFLPVCLGDRKALQETLIRSE